MFFAGSTRRGHSSTFGRKGLFLLLLLWLLCGCSSEPQVYGKQADIEGLRAQAIPLKEASHQGRVVVEGEVGQVCNMGCWFYLLDEKSLRHVDLDLGAGFVIPKDSAGKRAVVVGTLSFKETDRSIKAETVVLFDP